MSFFGFTIKRVKGLSVGNHRAHDKAIVDIQERLNILEKHGTKMAGKKQQWVEMESEIEKILADSTSNIEEG